MSDGTPRQTALVTPTSDSLGSPLTAGQLFGAYRIVRELGCGGMGVVFEAEALADGRRVALKLLADGLDDPATRERFLREGRMAATLMHPHAVYVYGSAEVGSIPLIAMELVPGGTLEELVGKRGPLPINEAVGYGLQLVDVLEATARAGILHRDVKPLQYGGRTSATPARELERTSKAPATFAVVFAGESPIVMSGSMRRRSLRCSPRTRSPSAPNARRRARPMLTAGIPTHG